MRATIEHESRGRMRLRLRQKKMTLRQADLLEAWLKGQPWARDAVVHERTCCVILTYGGDTLRSVSWTGLTGGGTICCPWLGCTSRRKRWRKASCRWPSPDFWRTTPM